MKILISHPTSNECNRAATYGLLEAGMLARFHTSVATFPGDVLEKLSSAGPFTALSRRSLNKKLKPFTSTWPWMEIGRQVALKAGLKSLVKHEKGLLSVDSIYQNFDRRVAADLIKSKLHGTAAIYAYQDGALHSFRKAKTLGIKCFYDLPIGHWRTARNLLKIEQERWPDWTPTLTGLMDSDIKLARQDEELRLADQIFVASRFTADTLKDFPGILSPIQVVPFGFPETAKNREYHKAGSRPLKLLFVGGLSQRKGLADLFAAVESFGKHVELTIVGLKTTNECRPLNEALAKHRWIPTLPHQQVLELMQKNDVLVFPSLFEGFGLVITEAMSQGMPVITTERTAGPDLITHDHDGWLIKAGSTIALQEAIEQLLIHPEKLAYAGIEAMQTAIKRPWEVYKKELTEIISKSL